MVTNQVSLTQVLDNGESILVHIARWLKKLENGNIVDYNENVK